MSVNKIVKKITVPYIKGLKEKKQSIVVLTAYDAITARLIDQSSSDIILIGDSLNMVFAGENSTVNANMSQMLYHTRIVSKASKRALIVADMPFLSYQISQKLAIKNAGKFIQAGAEAVKIEGGKQNIKLVKKLTEIGIPVMGHLGLTPQSIHNFGGFALQATENSEQEELLEAAKNLEKAGCFSIVLEKIPADFAKRISESLRIPTIGIGAGVHCDGQVLVTEDLLGLFDEFQPKFVRRYNNLAEQIRKNLNDFTQDVRNKTFPNESESYK
jgi:3-methyl-2-oxobutanoate hydroxymethyltransferase